MDLARALAGPDFYDCAHCARNPGMYAALGHDGPPQQYWRTNLLTGERLTRCPVRTMQLADPETMREFERERLERYPLYKAGHLLVGGGVAEQPARYLEYMRLLESTERAVQAKHDELAREEG